jgi:hypothetical protein
MKKTLFAFVVNLANVAETEEKFGNNFFVDIIHFFISLQLTEKRVHPLCQYE